MSTSFQRCTDRGMGDRLQQDNIVFGAADDPDYTPRQIRGAALAGSVAGAIMGGPVIAATVAAGAVYAAAKDDGGLGDVARSMGELASDISEKTGKTINRKIKRSFSGHASKFESADDRLRRLADDEVRRREAELIMSGQNQPDNPNRLPGKIRKFSSNVYKRIKGRGSSVRAAEQQRSECAPEPCRRYTFQEGLSTPRLQQTSRDSSSSGRGWFGRSPSFKDERSSVDDYVAQAKKASSSHNRPAASKKHFALKGNNQSHSSAMSRGGGGGTRAVEKRNPQGPGIVYRIVKRTVQPYSLSQDEMRALAHHVASQVLASLANCQPVVAVTGSSVGLGVKNNYITSRDMKLISSHISREVETAVGNSAIIQGNCLSEVEVMALARHIVRQVMLAVSNSNPIQDNKLSSDEMKSLARFVKDQAENQTLNAVKLSGKEIKSLACYLKLQAQQSLTGGSPKENFMLASDMQDFIAALEEENTTSGSRSSARMTRDTYDSKEDSYSDSDGSYTDYSESSYDGEDDEEWSDHERSSRPPQKYDSRTYQKRVTKSRDNSCLPVDFESDSEDCGASDYDDDRSYASDEDSYDSRGSRRSYDSSDSRSSYDSRASRSSFDSRRDYNRGDQNHDVEAPEEGPFSDYEESVCSDKNNAVDKRLLQDLDLVHTCPGNDSEDEFEDAVMDGSSGREGKKKGSGPSNTSCEPEEDPAQLHEMEEAQELALQIIEKMLLS